MQVFRFCEFVCFQTPIHASKLFFLLLTPSHVNKSLRLSHYAWKSVDGSKLQVSSQKGVNKNNFGYILLLCCAQKPPVDGCALNLAETWWLVFWWSVEGCRFCKRTKMALSHWQSQSPLTQGWRYRTACDYTCEKKKNEQLSKKLREHGTFNGQSRKIKEDIYRQ